MEQQKMVSTRHIGHWSSNVWFKKLRWKYEQLHDKRRPIVVQWYIFLLYQNRLLFKCICVFTCCTTIILTSQHHQQGKRHFIFPFRLFCCSWSIFLNPWKHTRTHQIVTTASTATDNKTVLLQSQLSVSHFFSSINNFCWQKNPRRRYPCGTPFPKNIANWTFIFTVIHVSSITTHPAHTHHATEPYYYTNLKK